MRTGIFTIDGEVYRFSSSGPAQEGFYEENGNKYYFDADGKRASGFRTIEGKTYFFSRINNNEMRTGIFTIDGEVYRFSSSDIILMQMEKEQVVLEQ